MNMCSSIYMLFELVDELDHDHPLLKWLRACNVRAQNHHLRHYNRGRWWKYLVKKTAVKLTLLYPPIPPRPPLLFWIPPRWIPLRNPPRPPEVPLLTPLPLPPRPPLAPPPLFLDLFCFMISSRLISMRSVAILKQYFEISHKTNSTRVHPAKNKIMAANRKKGECWEVEILKTKKNIQIDESPKIMHTYKFRFWKYADSTKVR